MAGHKLERFQFSDPISKEAASRTTRYRLLKKRRSDEYQTSVIPPEGIEVAEQELIDENESTETAELALTNSCIAASDNEANPSNHGEDSDVNLPVYPVTAYDNESEMMRIIVIVQQYLMMKGGFLRIVHSLNHQATF